ncbi:MAG: NAD(P)-dependent glycerol-3-phosphate dehydrogenase [Boseongicola sp.]|nr:NAD(P)-dependent glycerol-3-phosphate dehydrogenase [Boseongicola sp.]
MTISVLGAGAFGTALAIALSRDGTRVTLWSRDPDDAARMQDSRRSGIRLPGHLLPDSLTVTTDRTAFDATISLVAVPTQHLASFLQDHDFGNGGALIACCKGVDRVTGLGPVATIRSAHPSHTAAIVTGPSFAVDIANGLPTAIVLATERAKESRELQSLLTRPALRLYRSTDVRGAELGGALKNVVALAAGIAVGAGLGDSARASVVARGFGELVRYAALQGASKGTLHGLSGLGDLVLTCTSEKSRNFSAGVALGQGKDVDRDTTVEGLATAPAVAVSAAAAGLGLPLMQATADVIEGRLDIARAVEALLSRPVGKE